MMAFENVGFSRPVQSSDPPTSSSTTAGLRFLCCADCEMGPIGYNFTGKDRFYVAADRVRYKC